MYRYYIGRSSSELTQLVPSTFSRGRSTRYSDKLHGFSVTIHRCCKGVYVNSICPRTAKLGNSLPKECFPLTYDLNDIKSRIKQTPFVFRFFLNWFLVCFNLFVLLFLVIPWHVVAVRPCMEWIPIKKNIVITEKHLIKKDVFF